MKINLTSLVYMCYAKVTSTDHRNSMNLSLDCGNKGIDVVILSNVRELNIIVNR
jgi:hypothetical protein